MEKNRQLEILRAMYDLNLAIISMSDNEVEIFKQNNRHLISQLIQHLEGM